MKTSIIFLASALVYLPVWAADSDEGASSLERRGRGVVLKAENKISCDLPVEDGKRIEVTLEDGSQYEVTLTRKKGGYEAFARNTGEMVRGSMELIPGGRLVTTPASILAFNWFGTTTLTEALLLALKKNDTGIEGGVFSGLTKVAGNLIRGTYTIRNHGIRGIKSQNGEVIQGEDENTGFLSIDGCNAEVLSNQNSKYKKDDYVVGGQYRRHALWKIREADGGVIIRNVHNKRSLIRMGGFKTPYSKPYSGYYAVLAKPKKSLDGKYPDDAVWDVYQDAEGKYFFKNRGADPGLLCYADTLSIHGQRAEVLGIFWGSSYKETEYIIGGAHRDSIRWDLLPVKFEGLFPDLTSDDLALLDGISSDDEEEGEASSVDGQVYEDPYFSGDGEDGGTLSSPQASPPLSPERRRVSVSAGTQASGDAFAEVSGNGGPSSLALLGEDIPLVVDDGVYTIQNYALYNALSFDDIESGNILDKVNINQDENIGLLARSEEPSRSGFYTEVLNSNGKSYLSDNYLSGAKYRNNVLWRISKVENEYYTIENLAGGLLTWVDEKTYSGYYLQTLADNGQSTFFGRNKYPSEKDKYSPGGDYRNDVLWRILKAPDGGGRYYTLQNMGKKFSSKDGSLGLLCYTSDASYSGQYAQALHSDGSYYNQDKEKYKIGGGFRGSILWKLFPAMS